MDYYCILIFTLLTGVVMRSTREHTNENASNGRFIFLNTQEEQTTATTNNKLHVLAMRCDERTSKNISVRSPPPGATMFQLPAPDHLFVFCRFRYITLHSQTLHNYNTIYTHSFTTLIFICFLFVCIFFSSGDLVLTHLLIHRNTSHYSVAGFTPNTNQNLPLSFLKREREKKHKRSN
jgi:hypothetical protein